MVPGVRRLRFLSSLPSVNMTCDFELWLSSQVVVQPEDEIESEQRERCEGSSQGHVQEKAPAKGEILPPNRGVAIGSGAALR